MNKDSKSDAVVRTRKLVRKCPTLRVEVECVHVDPPLTCTPNLHGRAGSTCTLGLYLGECPVLPKRYLSVPTSSGATVLSLILAFDVKEAIKWCTIMNFDRSTPLACSAKYDSPIQACWLRETDRSILSKLPTGWWHFQLRKKNTCDQRQIKLITDPIFQINRPLAQYILSSIEVLSLGSGCPPHTTISPVTKLELILITVVLSTNILVSLWRSLNFNVYWNCFAPRRYSRLASSIPDWFS
jgi:hypothetical protein